MNRTLDRLDAIHQSLSNTVSNLQPEVLQKRPSENEWSIAEVLHHLFLVEEQVFAALQKGLAGPPVKVGFLKKLIPMRIVSFRFIRVKAPKMVRPTNTNGSKNTLKEWDDVRCDLKRLCKEHGSKRLREIALPHPLLGKIDGRAAISMLAFHEVRHHKQIKEIIKKL